MSVVVCSRDRPVELEQALAAVTAAVGDGDEVVVVDSASRDRQQAATIARQAGCVLVRSEEPGLSRARNLGVQVAKAQIVAFTDDDCRPAPGWIDAIAAAFEDPQVGVVAGRVVGEDAGGVTVTTITLERPHAIADGDDPMDFLHGANMAFRRGAIEAAEGFDELLGAGASLRSAEDHDLAYRVLARGWSGRYEPGAVVAHRQWRTRGAVLRLEYGYGLGSGAFAVKIARLDRRAGLRLLSRRIWGNGLAMVARSLVRRHETAAASSAVKLAGVLVGAARAARLDLVGERFAQD